MVSAWWMVAHYLLPLPLILFALLALPGPKRGILLFCTRVFDLPLIGIFRLLHVAFFLTGIAFFGAFRQLRALRDQQQLGIYGSPNQEIALLSKKWRTERNLWIAAFAFAAWAGLAAFYRETQRRVALEDELHGTAPYPSTGRGGAGTSGAARQPGKDAATKGGAGLTAIPLPKIVSTESGDLGVVEPSRDLAKQLEVQFEDERKELEEGEQRRRQTDALEAEAEAGEGEGGAAGKQPLEKKDD
ncbi:hypothetical protein F751_1272 [Auxenochlorella protothecoides]|uniref:BAP29/BAP31 transmembrane domain-containing protein n=1 Tax=Auxenochlorella protothecoides TaxID=3075 RepID=A0A087SMZ5_AUXPR|nr:hypothetical protein F751_1272 [Auxenochlorella protothecoides]KFM27099.1 hypothetical protein F751_1272 [Auxenochlorella protothecoides]